MLVSLHVRSDPGDPDSFLSESITTDALQQIPYIHEAMRDLKLLSDKAIQFFVQSCVKCKFQHGYDIENFVNSTLLECEKREGVANIAKQWGSFSVVENCC